MPGKEEPQKNPARRDNSLPLNPNDPGTGLPRKKFVFPKGIYPEAQEHTVSTKLLFSPRKTRPSIKIGIAFSLLVLAVSAYLIFSIDHHSGIKLQPPAQPLISNTAERNCEKEVDDKNFCQFVARFDPLHTSFTETTVKIGANGYNASAILKSDGHNDASLTDKQYKKINLSVVSINKTLYVKDQKTKIWTKYSPASTEVFFNGDVAAGAVQTLSQIIDPKALTDNHHISFKLVDKEYCGTLTCFKYQIIVQHVTSIHYIWFDSRNFLLRHESLQTSSGRSDSFFEYGPVTIQTPSPATTKQ